MALTSTLCGAPSPASTLVSAMPAARDTAVGALAGRGALAPILSTLMMRPQRRSFMPGSARRASRIAREQLEVEIVLPDRVGDLLELAGLRRAGIVDEDVDLAEGVDDGAPGAPRAPAAFATSHGKAPHLGLRRGRDAALGLGEGFGAARQDRHFRARLRELGRHRQPQPLAAAGDERSAAVEPDVHRLPLRSLLVLAHVLVGEEAVEGFELLVGLQEPGHRRCRSRCCARRRAWALAAPA